MCLGNPPSHCPSGDGRTRLCRTGGSTGRGRVRPGRRPCSYTARTGLPPQWRCRFSWCGATWADVAGQATRYQRGTSDGLSLCPPPQGRAFLRLDAGRVHRAAAYPQAGTDCLAYPPAAPAAQALLGALKVGPGAALTACCNPVPCAAHPHTPACLCRCRRPVRRAVRRGTRLRGAC